MFVSILVATEGRVHCDGRGQGEVCGRGAEMVKVVVGGLLRTIWGRSRESFPMVLKTKSCNLLTTPNRSSPRAAMMTGEQLKGREYQSRVQSASEKGGREPELAQV